MFTINDYRDATCVLCGKPKPVFVVTCTKATFSDAPFCIRCLEKQAALQSKTRSPNAGGETKNAATSSPKVCE